MSRNVVVMSVMGVLGVALVVILALGVCRHEPPPELRPARQSAHDKVLAVQHAPPTPTTAATAAAATTAATTVVQPGTQASVSTKFMHPDMQKLFCAYPSLLAIPPYPIHDKFSVIMVNYKRPNHLLYHIRRLTKSKLVHRVYIRVNSGEESVPDEIMEEAKALPQVRIEFPEVNSLHNRFIPPDDLETEWVLSLDDDIDLPINEMEWAFRQAQHYPAQIVGFWPRHLRLKEGRKGVYDIPHKSRPGLRYNSVLTTIAFLNSRWLHVYTDLVPKKLMTWVHENMNCEDILFNFMMSNATGLPPVLTVGTAHTNKALSEPEGSHAGLSKKKSHHKARQKCIKLFYDTYGPVLVDSDAMVTPFTFDVPALMQLFQSSQIYDGPATWLPGYKRYTPHDSTKYDKHRKDKDKGKDKKKKKSWKNRMKKK